MDRSNGPVRQSFWELPRSVFPRDRSDCKTAHSFRKRDRSFPGNDHSFCHIRLKFNEL